MTKLLLTTRTAEIDAGHRSPSSNTNGRRRAMATAQPATAVRNCGDVATTTSKCAWTRPATNDVTMNDEKSIVRRTTPSFGAMNVLTLITRIPHIDSTWYQRFL